LEDATTKMWLELQKKQDPRVNHACLRWNYFERNQKSNGFRVTLHTQIKIRKVREATAIIGPGNIWQIVITTKNIRVIRVLFQK